MRLLVIRNKEMDFMAMTLLGVLGLISELSISCITLGSTKGLQFDILDRLRIFSITALVKEGEYYFD